MFVSPANYVLIRYRLISEVLRSLFIGSIADFARTYYCFSVAEAVIEILLGVNRHQSSGKALAMQWSDIAWENDRIRVPSPKIEHHDGKASRTNPLFPEVRPRDKPVELL